MARRSPQVLPSAGGVIPGSSFRTLRAHRRLSRGLSGEELGEIAAGLARARPDGLLDEHHFPRLAYFVQSDPQEIEAGRCPLAGAESPVPGNGTRTGHRAIHD